MNDHLIHAAQDDAERCIVAGRCATLKTYEAICLYALQIAKGRTYFATYMDNPKAFYEAYVDHFAKVVAGVKRIPIPDDPRSVWSYTEA